MVGGELQLALNFDAQDVYFTFRPELSFYQKVYRRYGRFAIESKELIPDSGGSDLQNDIETIVNFKIPFNDGIYDGDLLKSLYLTIELPDIYSGFLETATTSYIKDLPQDFLWIKELGTYLVKNAKLKIGGNTIQELHDEYQDVWKELNLTKEEKKQYNIMTGNTPDMNNPSVVNGNQSFNIVAPIDLISNPVFVGTDFTFTEIRNSIPYASNIPSDFIVFYDNFDAVFQPSSQDEQKYLQFSSTNVDVNPTISLGIKDEPNYSFIPSNSELTYNYSDISKFKFNGKTYTKFYINKGNITFDANDTTTIDTVANHFSKPRITAYGGDNHSYILYKKNEEQFFENDNPLGAIINYTKSINLQFYNKAHFTPYIFNFTNKTFERSDGLNHGYDTSTLGALNVIISTVEDIIIDSDNTNYVVNATDSTFQLLSVDELGGDTVKVDTNLDTYQFSAVGSIYFTFNPLNNTFTKLGGGSHGYSNGYSAQLIFASILSGFINGSTYYVINRTDTTFQLSTTEGGAAVTYGGPTNVIMIDGNPVNFKYNPNDNSTIPNIPSTFETEDGSNHGLSNDDTFSFNSVSEHINGVSVAFIYTVMNASNTKFEITERSIFDGGVGASQWKIPGTLNHYMYNPANDYFELENGQNHTFSNDDKVQFNKLDINSYWPPFNHTTEYYVVDVDTGSTPHRFKLSTVQGGAAISTTAVMFTTIGADQYIYNTTNDTFQKTDGTAHGFSTGDVTSLNSASNLASIGGYFIMVTYTVSVISPTVLKLLFLNVAGGVNYFFDAVNNNFYKSDGTNHGLNNGDAFLFTNVGGSAMNYYIPFIPYTVTNVNTSVSPQTFQLIEDSSGNIPNILYTPNDGLLLGTIPISYMWNPETFFWKREDGLNHNYSNGDTISFSIQGTGYTTIFLMGTTYYIVNKTDTTFQLSLTDGGSVINGIGTQFIPTTFSFDGKLTFNTNTNTFQRQDGLPHGITENEGVHLDLINNLSTFQTIDWSVITNGFIQNITSNSVVENNSRPIRFITFSAKNVTDTTLQIYVIDLKNNTEYLFRPVSPAGNTVASTFSINSFMSEVTLNLETTSDSLSSSNTTVNAEKNRIQFITPLITMGNPVSHIFGNDQEAYRPTKPIGISNSEGGTTGTNIMLFTYPNIERNSISFYDQKFITNHYPYARRFDGNNLMKTEKNFSSFYNANFYEYDVEATVDKNTTYTDKQNSGYNLIDNGLDSIGDDVLPSISGRTLKIPLYFYFQRDIRKALPLIALNNISPGVELEITLRPIKDLYLSRFSPIVDSEQAFWNQVPYEIQNSVGYYIKNTDEFPTSGIQFFLGNNSTSSNTQISGTELTKDLISFSTNTRLEYNVIYLDKNERDRLIKPGCKHYFFIDNAIRETFLNKNSNENEIEISLKINKPLKELLFIPKRSDVKYLNQWDNFTNYVVSNLPTTSNTYAWGSLLSEGFLQQQYNFPEYNYGGAINHSSICKLFNTTTKTFPYPSPNLTFKEVSKSYYEKNIIKEIEIKSTNDSFKKRMTLTQSGVYYENQQISEYYKRKTKDGIYLYSFSLNPLHDVPTGEKYKDFTTNANKDFNITIKLTDKPNKDNYDAGYEGSNSYSEEKLVDEYIHEVNVYYVVYDILEVVDGTAKIIEYEDKI